MSGITEAISALLEIWGLTLPPWAFPAVIVAIMLVLAPRLMRNMRTGQARKVLKKSVLTLGHAGKDAEEEALRLVGDNPMGLVAVIEEALRINRQRLATETLQRLYATGKERAHYRRLRRQIDSVGLPSTREELLLLLERMARQEQWGALSEKVRKGMRRWPGDPDLAQWRQRLSERS